jgi:hypothetical protein
MKEMRAEILAMQQQFDEDELNPYHNAEHAAEVADRLEVLLKKLNLEAWRADVLRVAALFHDFGHSGRTMRDANDGLTNEEYAAVQADAYAKQKGFSVYQRILLQGEIIGTTFGNAEVKPETYEEKTLAIADIGGFSKSWDKWIAESAAVLKETPLEARSKTIDEWLVGRAKFLDWATSRMTTEANVLWGKDLEIQKKCVAAAHTPGHERRRVVEELITPLLNQH